MTDATPDPDRWVNRSKTITIVWQAIRAPLFAVLGTLLLAFLSIAWFVGHPPAPYLVMVDAGLLGLPFFFLSQGGGG